MAAAGMDRRTGRWVRDRAHLAQSIEMLFATRIGERVQRRDVGSNEAALQDKPLTERDLARAAMEVAVPLAKWEPRAALTKVTITDAQVTGRLGLGLVVVERLNALKGDLTPTSPAGQLGI